MSFAAAIVLSAIVTLCFSTLTYALRDLSRTRLEHFLARQGRERWLEPTMEHRADLIFITALWRLVGNISIVVLSLRAFEDRGLPVWAEYAGSLATAGVAGLLFSVTISTALAQHSGEAIVAMCVTGLHALRLVMTPVTKIMHLTDALVKRLSGTTPSPEDEIEKEILSVVEEGEKEGVVDTQEREMIVSVIEFRDTQVIQTMTARPEIVAIDIGASLDEVKRVVEESGHSRLPVFDGTLDHIVGILYARDLLKHLGRPSEQFDIRSAIRPAIFVPETKPLRDLLRDFRLQKVHIAIVLDEYGGTAGLVTIEDILEELVGEISDEHEGSEPAMIRRIDELTYEADGRVYIDGVNSVAGLNLPEDAGYDTLGGFISTALGRIPQAGATFEASGARYTVLEAEPQRVKRVRIELLPQAVGHEREQGR